MSNRGVNLGSAFHVLVGVLVGGLVLIGFFIGSMPGFEGFNVLVELLSTWTAIIATFALLLGLANLVRVHLVRIATLGDGWPYSAVLVGSALAVIVVGLLGNGTAGDPAVQWLFQWLYQPIAASLTALLVFFVASAAFRTLRAGPSAAWVMLGVALLVILGSAAWSSSGPLGVLAGARDWLLSVPVMAGMRGIALGAALGATATSLRIILGMDRPSA
jgi:hypothetical protein